MTSRRQSCDKVGIHIRHDDWLDVVNKMVHAVSCTLVNISEITEGLKFFPRNLLH